MALSLYARLRQKLYSWLTFDAPAPEMMPYDFNRLKYEIHPGDVLLIEGRSRISSIIRTITQSPWTHAALYIGRLVDFEDEEIKELIRKHLGPEVKDTTRLIIEDLIDNGTTISPLTVYRDHHIRICRPIGITPTDLHLVISYAVKALGQPYNVRHMVDLARFLLPWSILPRRWGSSLFETSGRKESGICSSLIAEAFASVQFPILPFIMPHKDEGLEVFQRNTHLYTPKDFDYSPYFEIIKYPLFNPDEPLPYYRRLPWTRSGMIHQDHGVLSGPDIPRQRRIFGESKDEAKTVPSEKKDPPANQD